MALTEAVPAEHDIALVDPGPCRRAVGINAHDHRAASVVDDFGGISFTTTGTTYNFGLGGSGPYGLILNRAQFNAGGNPASAPGSVDATLNVTAVPEPAAWSLMIAGFALVGFASRRRSAFIAA